MSSTSSPPPSLVSAADLAALQAQNQDYVTRGTALMKQVAEMQAREAALVAQVAALSTKGPRVKAPAIAPFTGAGGNLGAVVDSFVDDLVQTITYYGAAEFPNDAAKIRLATTYLRGVARTWWSTMTDEEHAEIDTWDKFIEALHRRFRPALPAELARRKLKDLKQRDAVNQYAGYFQQLLAHIPTKSDDDAIFDFRCGLDKAIAARVAEKEPKTLDEAIIIAVQAELYVGRTGPTSFGNRGYGNQPSSSSSSSSTSAPMDVNNLNNINRYDDYEQEERKYPPYEQDSPQTLAMLTAVMKELNALRAQTKPAGAASAPATKGPPKLTDAERDRCFRENLCLRCRGPGHRANECPKFPSNRQSGKF